MPRWLSSPLIGYVAAVLFTALGALARAWLEPIVGESLAYLTFFAALVLTAWFGGLGPTLTTTVLSTAVVFWLFVRAAPTSLQSAQLLVGMPVFVFCGVSIAFFSGLMRGALRNEAEATAAARDQAAELRREADEHLRTRRALEASEARLRLALSAGQMGVWDWDAETGRLYWDDTQRALFGLSPNEPITLERFLSLLHPEDREAIRQNLRLKASGSGGQHATEFRVLRPDGTVRWMAARSDVQHDGAGRVKRVSGVNFDVTDAKEAERRLRDSDRRKTLFLATLAHELRNPLAPIQTSIEILRRGATAAASAATLDVMDRQVRLLRRLVDDLLELSRVAEGKIELRRTWVTLDAVVRTAVETVDPIIRSLGRELEVALPPAPVTLHGDPARLAQILANLLNNAAKFTRPGGHIALTAALEEREVAIRVRDDGMGLAAEMLERIFEPFVQGDPALMNHASGHTGGLGVGLSLVRTLTEMHGGTVSAASDGPGRGAVFTVRLPLPDAALAGTPRPEKREETSLHDGVARRVLVVDDNRDAADSLARLVGALGAEARVAYDGLSALREAERFQPHAVFLDIGMPDIDGYAVARELRSRPLGDAMAIVAVTGWGQPQDRARAAEAGFDRHFVKPIDEAAVREILAAPGRAAPPGARPPAAASVR